MFKIKKRVKSHEPRTNYFYAFVCCFLLLCSQLSYSQCAMCRAALESEGDGVKAEAVNDGIVYLMVIPYILVGVIGYAIYKMKVKKKAA